MIKKFRLPVITAIGCLTALCIVAMIISWEQVNKLERLRHSTD